MASSRWGDLPLPLLPSADFSECGVDVPEAVAMLKLVVVDEGCGMNDWRPSELRGRPNDVDMLLLLLFPNEEPWLNGDVLGMLPARGDCLRSDPVADLGLGYGKLEVDPPGVMDDGIGPAAAEAELTAELFWLGLAAAAAANFEVRSEVRMVGCFELTEDPVDAVCDEEDAPPPGNADVKEDEANGLSETDGMRERDMKGGSLWGDLWGLIPEGEVLLETEEWRAHWFWVRDVLVLKYADALERDRSWKDGGLCWLKDDPPWVYGEYAVW